MERQIFHNERHLLKKAKAIYTTTALSSTKHPFQATTALLESCGFTMTGHWYWENREGRAIYVKKELLDIVNRSLNYSPTYAYSIASTASENKIWEWFRPAKNKSPIHVIKGVDYIYMINLDERPEKFAQACSELEPYGIFPFRFSAVNGWKLPTLALQQIGVKFTGDFGQEKFIGSVFTEIDGKEYFGNEIMRPNGETFFMMGMTHGAIGIVLSHLSILQDAWDSGYQTIWVMEDDVEALEDPRQIPKLIQELDTLVPDWDILFTDTDMYKDKKGNHVPCRAIGARPNFKMEPLSSYLEKFYPVSKNISRTGMRYGAYSMIIRRSGMEKILRFYKTYGIFQPYDLDLWLDPTLKMFIVNRDIVSQRQGAITDNNKPHYLNKS